MIISGKLFNIFAGILSGMIFMSFLSIQIAAGADFSLATDQNAMDAWQGSKTVYGAVVEYAVYEPGAFDYSFTSWVDPTDRTCYVYAYQITNTSSSDSIRKLTVNIDGNESVANVSEVLDPDLASSYVSVASSLTTSVLWSFNTSIYEESYSNILIFTSPYAPEWDTSSVQFIFSKNVSGGLPSPVPEPSVLYGLAIACGLYVFIRGKFSK